MNSSWETFITESQVVLTHFPRLELRILENEPPYLVGYLELKDGSGDVYERYQVKIVSSNDSTTQFPGVKEIGGRLPHNIDWHVFEDGHCCIKSVPEQIIICRKGLSLLKFIEEQALPYFHAQAFREQHGYFLHERSHGERGNLEYISGILKTRNRDAMIKQLVFILQGREPDRSNRCFCGSRKLYRHCHRDAFRDLVRLPENLLRKYISLLIRVG